MANTHNIRICNKQRDRAQQTTNKTQTWKNKQSNSKQQTQDNAAQQQTKTNKETQHTHKRNTANPTNACCRKQQTQ